ncbi:MAG: 16S rRNA (cytidine(1402)-2'-O)-methyltransferase [Tenericutes bacterium]|nr:16S rRNA (cytidine(1402)-2'-O)-methyltransferase [Mycoplasmatota bacterium]
MRQKSYDDSPSLYLIPTPVGNMEDITLRAINTLKKVDFLLCEDTRITAELLNKLDIKKKLVHSDDHNEDSLKEMVLSKLQDGLNIGLVTDRGTPIISDPGYKIVEYVTKNGFNVISLPGPTAFVPALTMSGINPAPFLFYGFLNSKESKRIKELESLKKLPYTIILYEAPHRITDMLKSLLTVFGNRQIALCREISKKYEEAIRGTIEEVLTISDTLKGEMVIVVEGNLDTEDYSSLTILEHINLYLEDGMSDKEAIKKVAVERGIPKSVVYKEYHIDN